jgi:hypothetical protein
MILIIINLTMLFIAFTNTQLFQAGLLRLLFNCSCLSIDRRSKASGDFNMAVYMTLAYLVICGGTRGWEAMILYKCIICDPWSSTGFRVLYIFFRIGKLVAI